MNKNYYDILELKKDCSQDDIKKMYKKLAVKWHPDKHINDNDNNKKIAEEKFKNINEAYEVLGDIEKRKEYDESGENPFTNNNNSNTFFRSFNMSNSTMFDSYDSFDFFDNLHTSFSNKKQKYNKKPKDEDIVLDLNLSLEELYNGTQKKLKIERKNYLSCQKQLDSNKNIEKITDILIINVLQGWKERTRITFENKGDIRPNSEPANLVFVIKQKPDNIFIRDDNNLIMTLNISNSEAINGFERKIKHLNEKKELILKLKGINESNYVHTIVGEGMPIRKDGKVINYGDLIIKFNVLFCNI
jgi:DnaJ family protein B protein 4